METPCRPESPSSWGPGGQPWECGASSPKAPGPSPRGLTIPASSQPAKGRCPWGPPGLRQAPNAPPDKAWDAAQRRGRAAPDESTACGEGGRPPHSELRRAWCAGARSLGGPGRRGGADTSNDPHPRGRGAVASQAWRDRRVVGPGSGGRTQGQAMPGEATSADLLLLEAGGPGPRTGKEARPRLSASPHRCPRFPRCRPPPRSLPHRHAPACLLPFPGLSAPCPSAHLDPDPGPAPTPDFGQRRAGQGCPAEPDATGGPANRLGWVAPCATGPARRSAAKRHCLPGASGLSSCGPNAAGSQLPPSYWGSLCPNA